METRHWLSKHIQNFASGSTQCGVESLHFEAFPCTMVGYPLLLDTPTVACFSAQMGKIPYG